MGNRQVFQEITLKINTKFATSEQILSWFEQLNQPPLPSTTIWWQCQTLLQEGFANIVEHGHKSLPSETPVILDAVRSKQSIEIRIWSYGALFDLEQKLRETSEFEDNDNERGRGLKIMSKIADKLSYEPTANNGNVLIIKKYY